MRPAEIPPDLIIAAGEELRAAGRAVTGFALRQKTGGGNPARLKLVWDEHLAGDGATPAAPAPELPPEIVERIATHARWLETVAAQINADAIAAAERRVTSVLAESAAQREQAERELADAAQTVEDLENKLDAANTNAGALETRLAAAAAAHQEQAVELAQLRERLAAGEQAAQAAAEQHAAKLADARAALDAERQAGAAAAAERDQARAELATVRAKADAAAEQHQDQRKQAAQEAHRAAERLTRIQAERDQATQAAASAREEAAQLRGQVEVLREQVDNLTRTLAAREEAE